MNSGMNAKTAQRDDWRTPPVLFNRLHAMYHFTVDGAADKTNALLPNYWTDAFDGPWVDERVFCNPPFSMKEAFAEKAAMLEADLVAMILPVNCMEQRWFHEYVIKKAFVLYVICGRVKFIPPPDVKATSPRFGSLVAVWGSDIFEPGCQLESLAI